MSVDNKNRKRLLMIYGNLYKRSDHDLNVCAYCGSGRECLDHVPPIIWIETFDINKYKKKYGDLLLYPSCIQCNQWLGKRQLFSYRERLSFLYDRYMKEIDKINGLWSDDEINEMSEMFQRMIRARQSTVNDLIKRFRHIESNLMNKEE